MNVTLTFLSCLLIQPPPFVHLPCFIEHTDCTFPGARTVFLVTCQYNIWREGSFSPYLGFEKASTEQSAWFGQLCLSLHSQESKYLPSNYFLDTERLVTVLETVYKSWSFKSLWPNDLFCNKQSAIMYTFAHQPLPCYIPCLIFI